MCKVRIKDHTNIAFNQFPLAAGFFQLAVSQGRLEWWTRLNSRSWEQTFVEDVVGGWPLFLGRVVFSSLSRSFLTKTCRFDCLLVMFVTLFRRGNYCAPCRACPTSLQALGLPGVNRIHPSNGMCVAHVPGTRHFGATSCLYFFL